MSTTVLAYVILLMGFITFLGGLFGALALIFEEVDQSEEARERFLMPIDNERTPTPKQTVDQRTARASFAREAIAVW